MAGRKENHAIFLRTYTQELIFSFNSLNHPTRVAFSSPFPVLPTKGIPAVKDKQEEDPGPEFGPSSAHVR